MGVDLGAADGLVVDAVGGPAAVEAEHGAGPPAAGPAVPAAPGGAAAAVLWAPDGLGLRRPPLPRAARRAVEDFWGRLQDFAALGMPEGWALPQGAPFLAGDGAGRLVPYRPPLILPQGV